MEFQICYDCKRSFSLPKDWEWKCPFCEITRLRARLKSARELLGVAQKVAYDKVLKARIRAWFAEEGRSEMEEINDAEDYLSHPDTNAAMVDADEIARLRTEVEELNLVDAANVAELNNERRRADAAEARVKELEADLTNWGNVSDQMAQESAEKDNRIAELQTECDSLRSQSGVLERELADAKADVSNLGVALNVTDGELGEVRRAGGEFFRELDDWMSRAHYDKKIELAVERIPSRLLRSISPLRAAIDAAGEGG